MVLLVWFGFGFGLIGISCLECFGWLGDPTNWFSFACRFRPGTSVFIGLYFIAIKNLYASITILKTCCTHRFLIKLRFYMHIWYAAYHMHLVLTWINCQIVNCLSCKNIWDHLLGLANPKLYFSDLIFLALSNKENLLPGFRCRHKMQFCRPSAIKKA